MLFQDRAIDSGMSELTPALAWWSQPEAALLHALGSSQEGLSQEDAARRTSPGPARSNAHPAIRLFARQFATPLVSILIVGALLSLALREWIDAIIILMIVLGSGALGFTQEYRASRAVAELRSRLVRQVRVLRDSAERMLPLDQVVIGDVVLLRAGDVVPGDGTILESENLLVDEALLTGEAFPVEKGRATAPEDAPIARRRGALFQGTSRRSGTARMLLVAVGQDTEFGRIEGGLEKAERRTEFARGLGRFGAMLMRVMLAVVTMVLLASILLGHDFMTSLLFAMALAVAISPELLPAIVSVTLTAGARRMTSHGVLVRRLEAIENLGGIDILCTDKTGTLTMGAIALSAAVGVDGTPSGEVLRLGALNAQLQTAMASALDQAVLAAASASGIPLDGLEKLQEEPYDFARRRFAVRVRRARSAPIWITKGESPRYWRTAPRCAAAAAR